MSDPGSPGISGFLKSNLEALEPRFPELARLIRAASPAPLETLSTPSGDATARTGGILLHSRYNPREEALRAARAQSSSGADTIVLLGLGLGYAAQAVLTQAPDARLVVAEADPAFLAACLDVRDLRPLLSDGRVSLLAGGEPTGLLWAFERLGTRRVRVLETKVVTELYPDWYAQARAIVARFESKETINQNTLRRFGRLWVRNLARNLDLISRYPGVAEMEGAFAGFPAVVLAAGPSLDDALPSIREMRSRAVLVCVDTALRSVLRQGVEPDFLVVVDPQYWNARHLDRCSSPSSILITEGAVWPSVLRMEASAVRLCASLYPLGSFVEGKSGKPKGRLGAGGSVSTTAWDFARVLGCRPVYMAGQDLGFPGGRTHARASRFEQKALCEGRRLSPSSTEAYRVYVGGQPCEGQANDGGTVRTDKRLSLYSWWFEGRMARHPDCATFNLSRRGLAISGMPYAPIASLLSLPERRPELDARLSGIRQAPTPDIDSAALRGEILGLLEGMEGKARAALGLTARARQAALRGKDPAPFLARLDEADKALLGNEAKEIAGFILPALEEILGRPATTFQESLDRSEAVYREIRDSAAFHRMVLSRKE